MSLRRPQAVAYLQSRGRVEIRRRRRTLKDRGWGTRKTVGVCRERARRPAEPTAECVCSFGATRVGPLIERVRLHVTTDRFLARRRGDTMWEAACDYAALALTRLESRLRPTVLSEWICSIAGAGRAAPRKTASLAARCVAAGGCR